MSWTSQLHKIILALYFVYQVRCLRLLYRLRELPIFTDLVTHLLEINHFLQAQIIAIKILKNWELFLQQQMSFFRMRFWFIYYNLTWVRLVVQQCFESVDFPLPFPTIQIASTCIYFKVHRFKGFFLAIRMWKETSVRRIFFCFHFGFIFIRVSLSHGSMKKFHSV